MECLTKCLSSLEGEHEFGNLATYSPLSISQIRERQEYSPHTLEYPIGNDSKGVIMLKYGYLCQRGLYPDDMDKENQDSFKIIPSFDGEDRTIMMGVFDGHGEYGDDCSGFVRDNIEEYLAEARHEDKKNLENAFRVAFRKINAAMHMEQNFSDSLSGTTAVVAMFEKTAVWVANVGDSRAIIGKVAQGELKAMALTTDQTPYRKDERERVRAAGGDIMSVDQREGNVPMHDNWDVDLGAETDTDGDPPRVWVPGKDKPGCAFTRSIGDHVGERVGVIPDPELTKKELKEHDKFVCLCSDGVWEFLTNQAVCDIIAQVAPNYDDALPACRAVVAESYRLWLQFDVRTDDITMIIAFTAWERAKKKKADGGGRGSIRGSISIGGDNLKKGGSVRPVRRGLSKAKRSKIASMVSADDNEDFDPQSLPAVPKTDAELQRMRLATRDHFLFTQLADAQKEQAYATMSRVETAIDTVIFNAGDTPDAFYIVDSGHYQSSVTLGTGAVETSTIKPSSKVPHPIFGDQGVMYSRPRTSTVTAVKPGLLWAIDRRVVRALIKHGDIGSNKQSRAIETLKSIEVLRSLKGPMLRQLASSLEEVIFEENEYIVRQGDNTQSMYLIVEGHVVCTQRAAGASEESFLMELGGGAYFGERSLLLHAPRAASVQATRRTTCLYMSKEAFEQGLGPLQSIIDEDRKARERIASKRRARQLDLGVVDSELSAYQLQGVAHEGDLGQFVLVKHSATGQEFTLKSLDKAKVDESSSATRVVQELKLTEKLVDEHRFVPAVIHTMESPAHVLTLFAGTRVATGLHEALQDYGPFDEATSLFYAANVFLGLEHLHKVDVVYRNVTPEAIMLGADGYAMLMDMHFAHELDGEKLYDLCGVSPYLAPEQVSGTGHTEAVDYWALGILIHEMMTEQTPFAKPNGKEPSGLTEDEAIQARITAHYTGSLNYPEKFSLELVGILDQLLEPIVAQRCKTPAAFRKHPWLSVVNWTMLENATVPAPFGPEMGKLCVEHASMGPAKCLPGDAYTGGSTWFRTIARRSSEEHAAPRRPSITMGSDDLPVSAAASSPAAPSMSEGSPMSPDNGSEANSGSMKKGGGLFGKKKKSAGEIQL